MQVYYVHQEPKNACISGAHSSSLYAKTNVGWAPQRGDVNKGRCAHGVNNGWRALGADAASANGIGRGNLPWPRGYWARVKSQLMRAPRCAVPVSALGEGAALVHVRARLPRGKKSALRVGRSACGPGGRRAPQKGEKPDESGKVKWRIGLEELKAERLLLRWESRHEADWCETWGTRRQADRKTRPYQIARLGARTSSLGFPTTDGVCTLALRALLTGSTLESGCVSRADMEACKSPCAVDSQATRALG
eukprot:4830430-Pleurochrysis_carterae.AAC.1